MAAAAIALVSNPRGSWDKAALQRELQRLCKHAEQSIAMLTRHVAARTPVCTAPWVDVYYTRSYFEALVALSKQVELRVNVNPHSAVQPGFWLRCRASGHSHCVWRRVTWVRRYRSFSDAVFSEDFEKSRYWACMQGLKNMYMQAGEKISRLGQKVVNNLGRGVKK